MVYNPFDFFRRNQKTFFAILTVVVMFMFVLQFGPGDFFSKVPKWFGSRSGETLAVIDGNKITDSDLRSLRQHRMWANEFMANGYSRATSRAGNYVFEGMKRASSELKPSLQNLLESRLPKRVGQNYIQGTDYIDTQMWERLADAIRGGQIRAEMLGQFRAMNIQHLNAEFKTLSESKTAKTDDVELANAAIKMMQLDLLGFHPRETFFATVAVDGKNTSAMEFELWKRKAEKLGITYTRADAEKIVREEFFGQFTNEDWAAIENAMLNKEGDKGFTRDRLHDALIDELKVRTAMTVVLGPLPGAGGEDPNYNQAQQAFAAPYEQFQYYKKLCDQTTYAAITVPVANFVDKVPGEPTVSELNELFKKYRNDEPNPQRELPGLKEPRKLKLEWLEVKGDEPYFKAKAKENLPKLEWLAKASGILTVPAFPNLASVLAAGAPLGIDQPVLQSAYQEYSRQTKENEARLWFPLFERTGTEFTDRSVVQPRALAAAAAAVAASRMTMAGPFDPVVAMGASAMIAERDARIKAGAVLFLPPTLATPYIVYAQASQPLPLAVVADDLRVKVLDQYARQIAFDDLTEFRTKLTELGKPKDQAPARDYLEKFVKDRGLKSGASLEFRDMYSVGEDAGLKPLKDRSSTIHAGVKMPNQFGPQFFGFTNPQTGQFVPVTALYSPVVYPGRFDKDTFVGSQVGEPPTESTFFFWQTAELPAEAPKTLDAKTREKAIAAWKRIKARDMAKAKADEIAKEAAGFGTSPIVIRQRTLDAQAALQKEFESKEAKDRVKFFYFPPVSQLVTVAGFSGIGRDQVSEFQLTPREEYPYPDFKMQTDLLENRDKPLSYSFVMADLPKDTFYVTVLEARDAKGAEEFGLNIYAPTPLVGVAQSSEVLGRFSNEKRRRAREDALALLKVELRYEKEHPDFAKKSDSSD